MADEVTTTLALVAAALPGGGETREGQSEMATAVVAVAVVRFAGAGTVQV